MAWAPGSCTAAPFTATAAVVVKKWMTAATSSVFAHFVGSACGIAARFAGVGVSMVPGRTALARPPNGAISRASEFDHAQHPGLAGRVAADPGLAEKRRRRRDRDDGAAPRPLEPAGALAEDAEGGVEVELHQIVPVGVREVGEACIPEAADQVDDRARHPRRALLVGEHPLDLGGDGEVRPPQDQAALAGQRPQLGQRPPRWRPPPPRHRPPPGNTPRRSARGRPKRL